MPMTLLDNNFSCNVLSFYLCFKTRNWRGYFKRFTGVKPNTRLIANFSTDATFYEALKIKLAQMRSLHHSDYKRSFSYLNWNWILNPWISWSAFYEKIHTNLYDAQQLENNKLMTCRKVHHVFSWMRCCKNHLPWVLVRAEKYLQ